MDEKMAEALIQAVVSQRDQALNAAAQLQAHLTVTQAERDGLKKDREELKKELEALRSLDNTAG